MFSEQLSQLEFGLLARRIRCNAYRRWIRLIGILTAVLLASNVAAQTDNGDIREHHDDIRARRCVFGQDVDQLARAEFTVGHVGRQARYSDSGMAARGLRVIALAMRESRPGDLIEKT